MLTTTNNDILFDDLSVIKSLNRTDQLNNLSLSYNDCDNRYTIETAENISPDCNCSGYTSTEDEEKFSRTKIAAQEINSYNDCSN